MATKKKTKKKKFEKIPGPGNFDYYKLVFRLKREFFGTCSEASIHRSHVIQKTKKAVQKANAMSKKLLKFVDQYGGNEITESKEILEVQGIVRTFIGLLGEPVDFDLPNDMTKLLKLAQEYEERYENEISNEIGRATVFMRDKNNKPIISTHMVLGNFKAILRILIGKEDMSILPYKNMVGSTIGGDCAVVEEFMYPDQDIVMKDVKPTAAELIADPDAQSKSERDLTEHPIRFVDKKTFQEVTAIAISERLPAGTTFGCTLRVSKGSPINEAALHKIMDHGKNLGFGSWRSSGGKGQYFYQIELIKDYKEVIPDGWL